MHTMANERADFHSGERLFDESAQFRNGRSKAGIGYDRDVLREQVSQPHTFARLRIDKKHRSKSPAAIKGMNDVRPYHDSPALEPILVIAANVEGLVE